MTQNLPRQQHYLPKGYLKGFTDQGYDSDAGELRVIDLHTRKCFTAKPDGVAKMRDFYVFLNTDGQPDYRVEKEILQQVDSDGARVIRNVARTMQLPTGRDWEILATFIAFLQLRVPQFRQANQEVSQHIFDLFAQGVASSLEAYEESIRQFEAETGEKIEMSYEEFRDDVVNNRLIVEEPRTNDIKMMLELAPQLVQTIFQMTPHLMVATGSARFITGDVPICMFDTNDERREARLSGVGWQTPEVEATLPLSSTCCLILNWDREPIPLLPGSDLLVAQVNTLRAAYGRRYLFYPPGTQIPLLYKGKPMTWGEDTFIESFADQKLKEPAIQIMGGGIPRRPPENVR